ncbi:MAG: aminotransferase class I/II-fold pyridoxal phosphate-dependent enzyme [Pseudomonadota bacterium]
MQIPERFSDLPDYAFPRLRALLGDTAPGGDVVAMSIGEPRHPFPDWVADVIAGAVAEFGNYPPNEGTPELLGAISAWIKQRHGVDVAPERILTANGTRETLFAATLGLCPEEKNGQKPLVLIPNPFYQVYSVGALAAGAEPFYVPATRDTGFLPDYNALPKHILDRTAILFICSPSNPQGAVASRAYLTDLLDLAEQHDFRVFADECYSEIYRDTPPPGLLSVAAEAGADPERVVTFNSLSKRSSVPGLRSGFAAAGPETMVQMRRMRSYSGAPLPAPLQRVAERLWADEDHVKASRDMYVKKYDVANRVFDGVDGCEAPEAGFFLWLPVDDDEKATLKLWQQTGVRVLPGAYLGRETADGNAGRGYIRAAMITADEAELERGLTALRDCLYR